MEIPEIKSRLSIEVVLLHYGHTPDRNKMLCCPFHADKTPSMQVYPDSGTVYCFSTNCKLHGRAIDVIDFIMHKENLSKHEAIKRAILLLHPEKASIIKVEPKRESEHEDIDYEHLLARMQTARSRSQRALKYLSDRGLDEATGVGYNPGTFYKRLRQCIVFGLQNEQGEVVSFYGRCINPNTRGKHFYTKNRSGLYPGWPSVDTKRVILCESVIDAASVFFYTEDETVLALYGTNGLSEEHQAALDRLKTLEEIVLFFDGDDAGRAAVAKWGDLLRSRYPNTKISRIDTPEGEDANSLLVAHSQEIMDHLIANRILFSSPENTSNEAVSEEEKTASPAAAQLDMSEPELLRWRSGNLCFTLLGGVGLHPLDRMVVTIKMERTDSRSPLHRLRQRIDLYQDDAVEKLARKAAGRLEIGSTKLHTALLELTDQSETYRAAQLAEQQQAVQQASWILTATREKRAIKFLKSKRLLKRTNEAIAKTGVVGERINRMILWLVFSSRLRERPLHVLCLGASGTGKTYLQEKISDLIPEEQKLEVTALSENALYYFERSELKHKLVLIEDLDGAAEDKILYAIRELQSKRRITKTIPLKDNKGNLKTVTLCVEGPICLAGTTTRERLYEDNANRSLLIYLDNSAAQKEAIMNYQRKLSAGTINETEEEAARELLRDVQCVLKKIKVINPYAEQLAIPPQVFKPLRSNAHYLAFIETVTFYHQYQREVKTDAQGHRYIETTLEDIEAANKLLADVLLAKSDELSKATRRFLEQVRSWLNQANRSSFYAKEIRHELRLNPHNVKYYLSQLVMYGYARVVSGNRYKSGFEYELTDYNPLEALNGQLLNALEAKFLALRSGERG